MPTSSASIGTSTRRRTRWPRFRPDVTPLVDLAFLLLTFFLVYTTCARAHVMQLSMPTKDGYYEPSREAIHEHGAMTILLGRNHCLHYYYGLNTPHKLPVPEIETTDFGAQGIRRVLLTLDEPSGYVIFIKPTLGATYKDIIDILDEMNITSQKKYVLVAIAASDTHLLQKAGY